MLNNNATNNGLNTGVIANTIENVNVYNGAKIPLLINRLIEALADLGDNEVEETYRVSIDAVKTYDINKKIEFNDLIKYKKIIREHSKYTGICEKALNIIDNNNIGAKKKILKNIRGIYDKYKGDLSLKYRAENIEEMEIIRKHADDIIDYISQQLQGKIINGYQGEHFFGEDIDDGLNIIICYAFIECKILEKPR